MALCEKAKADALGSVHANDPHLYAVGVNGAFKIGSGMVHNDMRFI